MSEKELSKGKHCLILAPEIGLIPQLLDRFGLSVEVLTPGTVDERIEVIKRRDDYDSNPDEYAKSWD